MIFVNAGPIKSSGTSPRRKNQCRASISAKASMIRARQSRALIAEQALQLAQRLTALRVGLGIDQIGETFRLREVELAVLESAAREFAGFRRRGTFDPAERAEHRSNHRAAAVQMELGDVFAGLAVRAGKPQRQRLVERLAAVRIAHSARDARRGSGSLPARATATGRPPDRTCGQRQSPPAGGPRRGRRWSGRGDASPNCPAAA